MRSLQVSWDRINVRVIVHQGQCVPGSGLTELGQRNDILEILVQHVRMLVIRRAPLSSDVGKTLNFRLDGQFRFMNPIGLDRFSSKEETTLFALVSREGAKVVAIPMQKMPARFAASIPLGESSMTIHRWGDECSCLCRVQEKVRSWFSPHRTGSGAEDARSEKFAQIKSVNNHIQKVLWHHGRDTRLESGGKT